MNKHFDCKKKNMKGGAFVTQSGNHKVAWDTNFFATDILASGAVNNKVTGLTWAMMEDTHWYKF